MGQCERSKKLGEAIHRDLPVGSLTSWGSHSRENFREWTWPINKMAAMSTRLLPLPAS